MEPPRAIDPNDPAVGYIMRTDGVSRAEAMHQLYVQDRAEQVRAGAQAALGARFADLRIGDHGRIKVRVLELVDADALLARELGDAAGVPGWVDLEAASVPPGVLGQLQEDVSARLRDAPLPPHTTCALGEEMTEELVRLRLMTPRADELAEFVEDLRREFAGRRLDIVVQGAQPVAPGDDSPGIPMGHSGWHGARAFGTTLRLYFVDGPPDVSPEHPAWSGFVAEVQEDDARVVVTLHRYRSRTPGAIPAVGYHHSLDVALEAPLAARELVDGATGQVRSVFTARPLEPDPLPPGWMARAEDVWGPAGRTATLNRGYGTGEGLAITVQQGGLDLGELHDDEAEWVGGTVEINGATATWTTAGGLHLKWTRDGQGIHLLGANVDEPTMIAFARSLS